MDLKKQPRHKEGVKQESRQVHRHPFALLSISVWQLDDRIECFALTPANKRIVSYLHFTCSAAL